ncbi:MAG: hypothetical protein R2939_03440 [Kofleriaceae bacterium]
MAEQCFPGIRRFYQGMQAKPATFLQLLWAFEADRASKRAPARPAARRRRS